MINDQTPAGPARFAAPLGATHWQLAPASAALFLEAESNHSSVFAEGRSIAALVLMSEVQL
jgi:hypothetical protein